MKKNIITQSEIASKIYIVRSFRVMLDRDLARLYGVETRVLNQAVRRNIDRFPEDFMFQITVNEYNSLRSQFVTLKKGRGQHRKYLPFVFTEQGIAMLSSVLNSKKAIEINIQIMRTFIKLRKFVLTNKELRILINKLEKKIITNKENIRVLSNLIHQLLDPPKPKKEYKIEFRA
jgi:phage regulator Rha-like protein